jgi:hypothetical protein
MTVACIVLLATVLVYLPALNNGFVDWDDHQYVYKNPNIWFFNLRSLQWMFTAFHVGNWHPLTWLSHAVDYALWGLNPMGHHLTSVLLHGLNTFLVVLLITRLVCLAQAKASGDNRYSSSGSPLLAGAVTGLLFGLHPLHVESVAWVSERKDLLYALFYMLSVLSYMRYAVIASGGIVASDDNSYKHHVSHSERGGSNYRYYMLCLMLFMFSLMSKPMAVTLPAVLLLLDVYPLERFTMLTGRSGKGFLTVYKVFIEKIPFLILSVVSSVIAVQAQEAGDAMRPLGAVADSVSFTGILSL